MTRPQLFDNLDQKFHAWFPFDDFNQIQQQCLPVILNSDQNIVISAPTGSGKTTMFEFAMIRTWQCRNIVKCKLLYICPLRALCSEKFSLWKEKFKLVGKKVIEITGNDCPSDSEVESADLIVTTPEKWDYMTRSAASKTLIQSISLILIDEIHILNDVRGAILEAIICRMRLTSDASRIIAVSATVPNITHLSLWLMDWKTKLAAKVLRFPDSMRPVPLKSHVLAFPMNGKNAFTFEFSLNYKLPDLIRKYSQDKPTLVFCSTRKSTEKTAEFLINLNASADGTREFVDHVEDIKLKEFIQHGIGFHHAGLSQTDRELVESLYKSNRIKILCSTSTLAIGVNLPAHLVIIKSTLQYSETGYCEYSDLDIRQMIGRAGRAGYDSHGVALILTSTTTEHLYNSISEGKIELESRFTPPNFLEYLNIEICNENIKSFEQARMWTRFSFLYTRMKLDPKKYFDSEASSSSLPFESQMFLDELKKHEVISFDESQGYKPTALGKSLTRNYIKVESLKHIHQSSLSIDLECSNLLKIICNNPEIIARAELRPGDKMLIHRVATDQNLLFPLPKSKSKNNNLIEKWMKPFFFIQIALQTELAEFEGKLTPIQRSDQISFLDQSKKLLKFIVEYSIIKNIGIVARNALELLSSFNGLSWHSNSKLLQQFPSIGKISATSLFNAGIRSIHSLYTEQESRIELLVKRNPPFGHNLKRFIRESVPIPKLECDLSEGKFNISFTIQTAGTVAHSTVHLLVLAYKSSENASNTNNISNNESSLLLYEKFQTKGCKCNTTRQVRLPPEFKSYSCSLMFEDWAGLNLNICYDLKDDSKKEEEVMKSNDIAQVKDLYDFDLDVTEDLMGIVSAPLTPIVQSSKAKTSDPLIYKPLNISDKTKCKHACKDRLACAHSCCKFGIILSPSSCSTSSTSSTSNISPVRSTISRKSSFLNSGKRSLANAREYLRKYQVIEQVSPYGLITNIIPTKNSKNIRENNEDDPDLYEEIEFVLR